MKGKIFDTPGLINSESKSLIVVMGWGKGKADIVFYR